MNSYRRNNTRGNSPLLGTLVLVILLCAALFGIDALTGGTLRSYARSSGTVVWTAAASAGDIFKGSGGLSTRASLARENQALRSELALHIEENARYNAVIEENEVLHTLAALAGEEGAGVSARVLTSYRTSPYGTFTINAGEREGVAEGNVVLTPGGFILGSVTNVDAFSATVESLFAPGKETDFIVGDSAFTAIGRGGGNTKAEISREAAVAEGMFATAPAYGGRTAGLVGHIEIASSSATQTLFIRIPVNLATLKFVYVVPR
jgi:cell shape-determining protein MreC